MIKSKLLAIIPTYREAENIEKFINNLFKFNLDILIVDDNSNDGTQEIVLDLMNSSNRLNLLKRPSKLGLGSAYREGFKYAIKQNYTHVLEMDADFSHQFNDLKQLLNYYSNNDVVIGSRYIKEGKTEGWGLHRKILSLIANIYVRTITGIGIKDATSGFRIYSVQALNTINFETTQSEGYSFQIEMSYRAWKKNLKIKEVPITFVERESGASKMNYKIILEALFKTIYLKFTH